MFQQPCYIENVSLILSEVLADAGVDERNVLKRRRTWLLVESLSTRSVQLQDVNGSTYYLGSQSEGTTTLGLRSDTDTLICHNEFRIIQDWIDWEPGVRSYLMIQDETVSPGYCLLQCLRHDAPLPLNGTLNEIYYSNRMGMVLVKNKILSAAAAEHFEGRVRHGPALIKQGDPWINDTDIVGAYHCKSWPLQARQWLDQQGIGQWPSDDMKRYCRNTGCFVVGVGSKGSENEEVEWRISTSLAERCLMFNLNITQIRCYVLMKMILKTYITPRFEDTISSFMCKTVLFHCIANSHSYVWRENNLLVCLSLCLLVLYSCTLRENCPHFIIPGNNLMRGHIPHESKPYILEILKFIISSQGTALLGIGYEGLGARIQLKLSSLLSFKTSGLVSGYLLKEIAYYMRDAVWNRFSMRNSSFEVAIQSLLTCIFKLVCIFYEYQGVDQNVCCLLVPQFCTILGTVLASCNIQQYNTVSAKALTLISLGVNTDVASGKLKLASMLYCIGDIQRTYIVLRDIEGSYDLNIVEPICCCHDVIPQPLRGGFFAICDNHNEEAIQYAIAFCVRFMPCEINCVPHELRYEMFRSTEEDLAFRSRNEEDWMDCAVVDSLPYLYFLQYKTYNHLGRREDKQRALSNLERTIDQEPNFGHRETALNLLGQCMEQEDRARDALICYLLSLHLRERNNAAKFHICRLLSNIIRNG